MDHGSRYESAVNSVLLFLGLRGLVFERPIGARVMDVPAADNEELPASLVLLSTIAFYCVIVSIGSITTFS